MARSVEKHEEASNMSVGIVGSSRDSIGFMSRHPKNAVSFGNAQVCPVLKTLQYAQLVPQLPPIDEILQAHPFVIESQVELSKNSVFLMTESSLG